MTNTDIILVGFGPTSSVLANLLAPLGWNIKIFEQNSKIYDLPRAVFFDDEVMRIFQKIGLSEDILKYTFKVRGMDLVNQDGLTLSSYEAPTQVGPLGWHAGYMFHQPTLEGQLREKLAQYTNVEIHLEHRVSTVSLVNDKACIGVDGPNGAESYSAKFLIGCCGARSITRSALNVDIRDYGADQQWIVIDIELNGEVDLPLNTVQYCDPNRPSTYIPTPDQTRRFELMLMADENADDILRPEKISELLAKWLNPDQYRIIRSAVYEFHALVVEQWRHDNLFLAGDAAHQMPPFLGQGMCSGIKDAANLAWKLDFVLREFASDELLNTYEAERKPYVEKVIESDLWLSKMIQTTDRELAIQRDQYLFKLPPSERKLEPPTIKLGGPAFDKESVCGLPTPQPITQGGIKHDELLGKNLTLIGEVLISEDLQKLIDSSLITLLNKPNEEMQEWLNEHHARAILIRPDRYIQAIVNYPNDLEKALSELSITY
ncbi:bifunctional 3-(3-hydroxy-phenyl)propionate/3-hydroxycinnamic acid hydroxylase [Polynucleobacter sp. UK-Mo-2m-Kol15]|uniref:bifunctional 3-(3-hydroxy-phenyl)propionate/3-hydroxycinnamic acid hydroxylase n=1 Tax=Polynucleobacter sp. UK-Mo-2m-Kol15 TaxID=2576916 RepID=UPI001C0CE0AE|nr:bifunctional 3-(3-hydroxy-phenyl)propionate/3-hydroxycinnamic acid hydroxylase [Polynucleobacter sp. UK-Mo-2m-Kol15]MBU3576064.1 bifunctional 3-(3-hydroxy-phenyl)propionate/3-hydroxycinnamic acid hydroxylase [Polynucleobacter sp. UK-Mo-2m-Kol15]